MNYNFIYDEESDTYIDVFSNRGDELINYFSSVLKNKKKNKKNITTINKKMINNYLFDLEFTTLGKIKYNFKLSQIKNTDDIYNELELVFLNMLDLFIKDQLYTHISYFKFLYTIYKCIYHYKKHYKEIYYHNTDSSGSNISYNEKNILDICDVYHTKYKLSINTVKNIITNNYKLLYKSIENILKDNMYNTILEKYILDNYIQKV